MDFSIENHAPLTEEGFCSISIPSNTPPFPIFATPPSKPILPQQDVVVTDRLTLQPVSPSKRSIPESYHEITTGIEIDANEFLPKDLAQIIEERKPCELVWYARIMMCTCAISSIESALSGFMTVIEKDEATAIREYLYKAISKYTASEAPPLLLLSARTLDQIITRKKARIRIKQTKSVLQCQLQLLGPLKNLSNCLANRQTPT
ncbi:EKA-like protein [Blumeria hordei DH14]|uniref:EKA-like protein n=1 Tax=Blumeria graminis f. sp. hordei (strain DH14) TaxID=546991 RepID=N1JHE9_BLUG1|nr:EKA-like protein [Blumeria hordei DH14]